MSMKMKSLIQGSEPWTRYHDVHFINQLLLKMFFFLTHFFYTCIFVKYNVRYPTTDLCHTEAGVHVLTFGLCFWEFNSRYAPSGRHTKERSPSPHGVRRLGSLGNMDAFLMLSSPKYSMVTRSHPKGETQWVCKSLIMHSSSSQM